MKDIIVIPTYNERENIGLIIPLIFSAVPNVFIAVIDDNSPDGTAQVVKSLVQKYPHLSLIQKPKKEGLGKAYMYAFKKILESKNVRSLIMMDADLSHPVLTIPEMLKLSQDYQVVIGSRYVKGGATHGWELWRRALSFFGNIYSRFVTRLPVNDCTGGFNLIHVDVLRKLDFDTMDSSGYAFQIELKFKLHKAGARLKETPILFKNRVGGESKISKHVIFEGILAPWKMIMKG